jgi:hypothetical protein
MDRSVNSHIAGSNRVVEWVWYSGADALLEGEALCYDILNGTAANKNARRGNAATRPSSSNNKAFAGVVARDYPACATGQFVEINVPGSKGVNIALGANVTLNQGFLTFTVGSAGEAGRFVKGGLAGRGSALIRQTVADAVLEENTAGGWSLATDGVTLTVTDTSDFSIGDTVVLLGGEDEGADKAVVPGKYKISSITSGTVVVLSTSAVGATPSAALTCTGYVYTGNPKCQADLMDGNESCGVEFISLPNAGGDNQAYIKGGISYVCGGITLAADAECELANGVNYGEVKGFVLLGTLTTSDFVVDLVTPALMLDGSTALNEINAIDAGGDGVVLEWNGSWSILSLTGGATQA